MGTTKLNRWMRLRRLFNVNSGFVIAIKLAILGGAIVIKITNSQSTSILCQKNRAVPLHEEGYSLKLGTLLS